MDIFQVRSLAIKEHGKTVLENVSFTICAGDQWAIVGPSGSGKTTLLNILLRLYQENSGGIFVDKTQITKENLEAWYKMVSYVPQNITLIDGTITENIAFGVTAGNVDYVALKKAVQRAQLEEFISHLPDGVNTSIGEKGIKISGGQRQRIGIARALYHGGEILIFDEATSSLDSETERMLTESIHNISHQEYTIIIVAHRIQTLKYCDYIYRLEKGVLSTKPLAFGELV